MAANMGNEARILTLALHSRDLPSKTEKKPVPKRLYTIDEAAIYLGRTPNAVRHMLACGYLSYVRMGKKRIFLDKADMDRLIEESKLRYEDRF